MTSSDLTRGGSIENRGLVSSEELRNRYGDDSLGGRFKDAVNILWYRCRQFSWAVDPRFWAGALSDVEIDRPIFFVGNQGGGLTLVSRVMRRHPRAVTISGGPDYWAGADEMQRVTAALLPPELRLGGKILGAQVPHPRFDPPRSWTYASDELVSEYRQTEDGYDERSARRLRAVLRGTIRRFGGAEGARFMDKSQVLTLKIRYVDALLREADPHFVLITRNPYAACFRAALGKAIDMRRYAEFLDFGERLEICAQHWTNAIGSALEDGRRVPNFTIHRFEDFTASPEQRVRQICEFVGLEFDQKMMPAPDDEIPFGTRFPGRWHPIRTGVNERYLREMTGEEADVVASYAGELADRLGYERPVGT